LDYTKGIDRANNLSNYLTVKGADAVIDALKIKFDAAKEGY
jgi:hypothetical protein|tara:strand:- start:408 stop:530 length:123 start_codon:yes stop_codon:yes gene_type:complete